jgi:hypothetical protein
MKKEPPHGRGLSLDKAGWVTLARTAIEETFEAELVMTHAELEARLWEIGWAEPSSRVKLNFFPHILTLALQELERKGHLFRANHATKGAAQVDLISTANVRRRQTTIMATARRKGMLYARYDRWSSSFGDAGEAVLNHSLTEAMKRGNGFMPIVSGEKFGEVARLGDLKFPGAVDSAAWQIVRDPHTGMPLPIHLVLLEMKNRRLTLYPRHPEVYQVLYKAALAAQHFPGQPVVPALICRRGHTWLFWMAKDLGFLALQTKRQFLTLPEKTDKRYLAEVQDEIALRDLTPINGDLPRIIEFFQKVLPDQAAATAARWKIMAPIVLPYAEQLRKKTLDEDQRRNLLHQLYMMVELVLKQSGLGAPRTWTMPPEDAYENPVDL